MPTQDLNVVNVSTYFLSDLESQVLSRGLSFCPNQNINKFEAIKDLQLFARKLILKQMYSREIPAKPNFKSQELKALKLVSMLEENEVPSLIDQIDLEHLLGCFDQTEHPPMPTFKKK